MLVARPWLVASRQGLLYAENTIRSIVLPISSKHMLLMGVYYRTSACSVTCLYHCRPPLDSELILQQSISNKVSLQGTFASQKQPFFALTFLIDSLGSFVRFIWWNSVKRSTNSQWEALAYSPRKRGSPRCRRSHPFSGLAI
jgi:hypothetical protein